MSRKARILTASLIAMATWAPAIAAAADARDCRTAPYISATCRSFEPRERCRPLPAPPCFWVEGRLRFGVGAPAARLWPRGSHRLLGVHGGEGDPESPQLLPRNVDAFSTPAVPGGRRDVWGAFKVCPLATEKPGWMRPVCIVKATRLSVGPGGGP